MSFIHNKVFLSLFILIILNLTFSFVREKESFHLKVPGDNFIIKGITVVGPQKPIGKSAFIRLKKLNTEWVAFVPYGFTGKGKTNINYNLERQWWGEKPEGIESCIIEAKKLGLKIMLKPQIFIGDGWIGEMDFSTETEWIEWEKNYRKFIGEYFDLAIKHEIDLFCIGTEINIAVIKREKFWKDLIREMRKSYQGKLIYSANWDNYEKIMFWPELDFVGISCYFPLTDAKTPTLNLLNKEWKPIIKKLKSFSTLQKKKIVFTEYGYMSVDGCAGKAWEIEKKVSTLKINQQGQSNAYDALWSNLNHEDFWGGGFLWKWFPEGMGHEGYPEKDYTPQDKTAENIIKKWFEKNRIEP